jgi:alkyl hydroperoxide reductase subunit D
LEALNEIKSLIPDYAKDVRINLDSTFARSSLPAQEALGVALAAAYAAKSPRLVTAFRAALPEVEANAAVTAAALMAMNNAWYPYVEMTGDAELKARPAQLRMQAARRTVASTSLFELARPLRSSVSVTSACSHFTLLKESA